RAIDKCPAVKLRVGQLHSLRSEFFRESDHLWQPINILPVEHEVKAQRDSRCANVCRCLELFPVRAGACDPVSQIRFVRLKTELHGIQPGFTQRMYAIAVETNAAGDQVGVQACLSCVTDQLGQIPPYERFASGKSNL